MAPQKKIRVGAGFAAIWVLLGCAWLCNYFFGDTKFWQLALGELNVLLGIGAGAVMIREGRRGQKAAKATDKEPPGTGTADKEPAGTETATGIGEPENRQPE